MRRRISIDRLLLTEDKMDAIAKPQPVFLPAQPPARPSREEAEAAVRTLIAWAGDDPTREGLLYTPRRVTLTCSIARSRKSVAMTTSFW